MYVNQIQLITDSVIECLFPFDTDEVKTSLSLDVPSNSLSPIQTSPTKVIAEWYQKTDSWKHRRQLLSLVSLFMNYQESLTLIPDLTEYRFYSAKKHGEEHGYGLPAPNITSHRQKMDTNKLDNFLNFITSSHIVKDLPFGERKIKLSNGVVQHVPNIIRCMGAADIIDQYKAYCVENNISSLGDSTMYKILSECSATVRKSLEGLDYFVAEGGRAITDIQLIIDELNNNGSLTNQQAKNYNDILLQTKKYLKSDYKVLIRKIVLNIIIQLMLTLYNSIMDLKLNNAGCYKSNETMNALHQSGKIATFDFCEAQDGKGSCDRTAATVKCAVKRYINQGNDVLNTVQLKKVQTVEDTANTDKQSKDKRQPYMQESLTDYSQSSCQKEESIYYLNKFLELNKSKPVPCLPTKRWTDYSSKSKKKIHIKEESNVADHCRKFALSDAKNMEFQEECTHIHDHICQDCEQINELLEGLTNLLAETDLGEKEDKRDEFTFTLYQAWSFLRNWKSHIVRARNQDCAKSKILDNLGQNDIFIVLDWAIKFLPRRYREDQSNWFAKRGISWHILVSFIKEQNIIKSLAFIHIFEGQISQDSSNTTAVILDTVDTIQKQNPNITNVHLYSDNAGCYKSNETMNALHQSGKIATYDFCEAQDGKGSCDRTAATVKCAVKRYINQGNDVLNAVS
ncbi:Hypothetical predicted protein [Mytilus galloprovincialis]|uniref:Uncharacterized protein n=1 Tax=Mytilus galloprovincialis TaxID=29158 RepID=A0A8B6EDB6_MYTGA|nr:Hypothetical predicted protein [Mytilus galloprovincialis]